MNDPIQKPSPLIFVHRLTIGIAIGGAGAYAVWSVRDFAQRGDTTSLLGAIFAAAVAVALVVYLRHFTKKHAARTDARR
jgi:hypothetical protein